MVTARDGWASRWLRDVGFALLGAGCVLSSGDVAFVFLVAVVDGLALVLLHREREPAREEGT